MRALLAQDLVLREEACDDLVEYTTIPLSFLVDRVFRVGVPTSESEVVQLDEVPCLPHWKDYDEGDGDVPTDWSARFDTSNWRIFSAWSGEKRLGGIVVVHDSPAIDMLEGRDDNSRALGRESPSGCTRSRRGTSPHPAG